jgi:hypothetical protein
MCDVINVCDVISVCVCDVINVRVKPVHLKSSALNIPRALRRMLSLDMS